MDHFDVLYPFIHMCFSLEHNVKYYHWQTTSSFMTRKTSCGFLAGFSLLVDKFVETYLGHFPECKEFLARAKTMSISVSAGIENFSQLKSDSIALQLQKCSSELKKLDDANLPSDLLNIRDELVSLCKQTLYLFTFK